MGSGAAPPAGEPTVTGHDMAMESEAVSGNSHAGPLHSAPEAPPIATATSVSPPRANPEASGDADGGIIGERRRRPPTAKSPSAPAPGAQRTGPAAMFDPAADMDPIASEQRQRPLALTDGASTSGSAVQQQGPSAQSDIALSSEQTAVLNLVKSGRSVFFTGAAGTGKSFLLQQIIKALPKHSTFVTALTGIAAVPLGGSTLHSFAGIGLGTAQINELLAKIRRSHKSFRNWQQCRTLIIDEVSMLDSALFDKLEQIACNIRCNRKPFGGIQLVLVGDFFQLPPCEKGAANVSYCFEAESWSRCVPHVVQLTQIFRQKESKLIDMLNEIRLGKPSQQTTEALRDLRRELPANAGVKPTKLYSRNFDVDRENEHCLNDLPGASYVFNATDTGREPYLSQLDKYFLAVSRLTLKVGAQVMIIKNMEDFGVVNGSRGVIADFRTRGKGTLRLPVVRLPEGKEVVIDYEDFSINGHGGEVLAKRRMIPLKLAWAISIHKSQGMSIDYLEVKLDDCFAEGQAYVALSRARTLAGLRVLAFNPACCRTNPKVIEFQKTMQENGTSNEDILIDEGETENMWDLDGEAESNTTALAPLNAYDAQAFSRRAPRQPRQPRKPRQPRRRDGGWKTKPGQQQGKARSHPYAAGNKGSGSGGGARQSTLADSSKWNMFM